MNHLTTVRDTFTGNNRFEIPDYQRGYKWTVAEVRKLLEDISGFKPGNGLKYYCLQNLTLVRSAMEPNLLKVVDGQQRLTTCLIIIAYLWHRDISNLPQLQNGLLSFGKIPEDANANHDAVTAKTRQKTTQPFLSEWIINGQIWKDYNDILADPLWTSAEYGEIYVETLHKFFKQWLDGKPSETYDHSDIFHMFCAAMTVAAFFQGNDKDKPPEPRDFAEKFLDKVSFLHNIVEEKSSTDLSSKMDSSIVEAEIFSKINGFRVPLDGADLLRAIFITYAIDSNASGSGITEYEVRLNEARVKLGLELDEMGAWWQDKRHQKYFSMFDPYKDQDSSFDSERYPINILYKLFAASRDVKHISIGWFEKYAAGISKLYGEIRRFHSILKDWYEDVKLYHYAGFLVGQCGEPFSKSDPSNLKCGIYNLLNRFDKRPAMYKELKTRMFVALTKPEEYGKEQGGEHQKIEAEIFQESLDALEKAIVGITDTKSHNWYDEELFSVKKTLTLMDVIAFAEPDCLTMDDSDGKGDAGNDKMQQTKKRTPLADHLDPEFFTCAREDKEHIFPQTPIGGKDRRNLEKLLTKMQNYFDLICERLTCKDSDKREEYLLDRWESFWKEHEEKKKLSDKQEVFPLKFNGTADAKKWIDWLFAKNERDKDTISRINEFVTEQCKIELNSIGNIVMLDAGINRGYGNEFYNEKRKEIWAKYRACQPVRLHTYRVFAKEFPGNNLKLDGWDQDSIIANRTAIKCGIVKFFNELLSNEEAAK